MKLPVLLCGALVAFVSSAVDAHPVSAPLPPAPPAPPMLPPAPPPPPPPPLPQIVIPLEVVEACKGKPDGTRIDMAIGDGRIAGSCEKTGKTMGFALDNYTVHRSTQK